MRVLGVASVFAIVISTLGVVPAFAGGWAVTTLDSLPPRLQAGETYAIGYMIRQHGFTPFTGAKPVIRIVAGGEKLAFPGHAEGDPGHYVSQVHFPNAGTWTWSVDQMPFATQELGTLEILAPAVESETVAVAPLAVGAKTVAVAPPAVQAESPAVASGVELESAVAALPPLAVGGQRETPASGSWNADSRLIPWALGWLAVAALMAVGVVGWRSAADRLR